MSADPGRKMVIWGAGGHARVVADIVRQLGRYEIIAFLDDVKRNRWGQEFCGAPIVGGREQLDQLRASGVENLLFGFGDCEARLALAAMASAKGFRMPSAIHPRAVVADDAVVGAGSVVVAGAVVNPGVELGEHVIVNTCASVDHECVIEDGVHVGPGSHLGGRVRVRRGAWIGIGATVRDRVTVGAGAQIGAGAVVLTDVPAGVVAYGVPAQVIRRVDGDCA